MPLNAKTWALWLAASMLYCILTYNPVYQTLLFSTLLAITINYKLPMKSYMKAALVMSIIPLLVNTFLVHSGKTTVYEIPKQITLLKTTIPILLIGGPLTLESIMTGLIMSVFLLNMLTAFQIFNNLTTPDSLLKLVPSRFPSVALLTTITMRFIPTVMEDYDSIRDAQVSRGVRIKGGSRIGRIKNQLNIIVPTLITSLERAFYLSESMAARGYSGVIRASKNAKPARPDKILSMLYISSAILTLYNAYTGSMGYWPYDSLRLPPLSVAAMIPLLIISIPEFLKNERHHKV